MLSHVGDRLRQQIFRRHRVFHTISSAAGRSPGGRTAAERSDGEALFCSNAQVSDDENADEEQVWNQYLTVF